MFKKDYERTPQERAQRSMFSIVARLGGCAYLIYIIYQLLTNPPQESSPGPTGVIIITIVLIVAAVAVIAITVLDLIHAVKNRRFSASTYEELDETAYRNAAEEQQALTEEGESAGDADETEDDDAPEEDEEPAEGTPPDDAGKGPDDPDKE
jgi:hypothetical protein